MRTCTIGHKRLNPAAVSLLILLAGVAWTKAGRAMVKERLPSEDELYSMLKGDARRIADTICAIHERDTRAVERNRRYVQTAWAFVQDSIYRRYWPARAGEEEEFQREWAKLKPLRRLVEPYLACPKL